MSKLTLEEAISHCLEVAEKNECKMTSDDGYTDVSMKQCAADHRQLAEWLTELKQWRRVYGVCPSYEMCIPECKEGYNAQIAEYKRLLKAAVEDIHELLLDRKDIRNSGQGCNVCNYIEHCNCCESCTVIDELKVWRYADEVLALIGKEGENNA